MKKEIIYQTGYNNDKFFFISLVVGCSNLTRGAIASLLQMPSSDDDLYWIENDDKENIWINIIWVKGTMDFFGEAKVLLQWMLERLDSLQRIKKEGGYFAMVIGLSGADFIESVLDFESAEIISKLDLQIKIEVFPYLEFGSKVAARY